MPCDMMEPGPVKKSGNFVTVSGVYNTISGYMQLRITDLVKSCFPGVSSPVAHPSMVHGYVVPGTLRTGVVDGNRNDRPCLHHVRLPLTLNRTIIHTWSSFFYIEISPSQKRPESIRDDLESKTVHLAHNVCTYIPQSQAIQELSIWMVRGYQVHFSISNSLSTALWLVYDLKQNKKKTLILV